MVFVLELKKKDAVVTNDGVAEEQNISNTTAPSISETGISPVISEENTLTVNPNRCRGCGKCAMVDPEHFVLDGRVASVISNKNLDSPDLIEAISLCPVEAIKVG